MKPENHSDPITGSPGYLDGRHTIQSREDALLAVIEAQKQENAELRKLLSDLHRVTRPLIVAGTLPKHHDDCWAEWGHEVVPAVKRVLGL